VRGAVVVVVELARQEGAGVALRELLGQRDAAEEAAFVAADQAHGGAEAADQVLALLAHPVRHEDRHRVAQRAADRGEGDAGVAAGGLGDRRAGRECHPRVRAGEDVQRHAVLDAAGVVQVLGLGVDRARAAAEGDVDGDYRGVADQVRERFEAAAGRGVDDGAGGGGRHGRPGAAETADYAPPAGTAWASPLAPLRGAGDHCIKTQYAADR